MLGAHPATFDGIAGVRFAVWAPNAERVSVVGPFCDWDGRRLPMRVLGGSGVWELFVPGLAVGELYKFEIRSRAHRRARDRRPTPTRGRWKCGRPPPRSSPPTCRLRWPTSDWMQARARRDWLHAPMSIYEVHARLLAAAPGWRLPQLPRARRSSSMPYVSAARLHAHRAAADHRASARRFLGLPDHRLLRADQPLRHARRPASYFIDACHRDGIGVLLDWVPAHFPRDAHGLARFDGTALYEYADPRKGEHQDWGTLHLQLRAPRGAQLPAVQRLLLARGIPLRRPARRRRGLDALPGFRRAATSCRTGTAAARTSRPSSSCAQLNRLTHSRSPGTVIMAEESTDWPMVSRPVDAGGLGFSMKWNMGWMHDTLAYFKEDPLYRRASPRQADLRHDVRVHRELHPAAVARRGRAPEALAARPHARRPLAAAGEPAAALPYMWTMPGQEAAVHGRRVRASLGMGLPRRAAVVPARARRASRRAAAGRRT